MVLRSDGEILRGNGTQRRALILLRCPVRSREESELPFALFAPCPDRDFRPKAACQTFLRLANENIGSGALRGCRRRFFEGIRVFDEPLDERFDAARGELMLLDVFGGFTLERLALKGEEGAYLPGREDAVREKCLYGCGQAQKAYTVGDRRAAACDAAGKLFLREFELAGEALVGTRLFDGVQILTLEVLDERHLGKLGIRRNAKYGGDFREPRELCRTQAALACDEFVRAAADIANDEGL